jgi:hypothetical protein
MRTNKMSALESMESKTFYESQGGLVGHCTRDSQSWNVPLFGNLIGKNIKNRNHLNEFSTSFRAFQEKNEHERFIPHRPATRLPKMLLIAAVLGNGTLNVQNWRFSRLGMSFLPPPGSFIAAMYSVSTILFISPGFSRL